MSPESTTTNPIQLAAGATFTRVFIIGMGEVGRRLAGALEAGGIEVVPVTRDSGWTLAASPAVIGLRLICVREEALAEVLERLREIPPWLLVATQNGWIRPLLADRSGLTRGLIWFRSKGELLQVLRPSPFCGPAAGKLASLLSHAGLAAEDVTEARLDLLDCDKMAFNCVVGLPLAVRGITLGEYLTEHAREARTVFTEALLVCAEAVGCTPGPHHWNRFVRSVEPLRDVTATSAKALELRNGAVVRLSRELGHDASVNARLLAAFGVG